jgi:hypothetical protein
MPANNIGPNYLTGEGVGPETGGGTGGEIGGGETGGGMETPDPEVELLGEEPTEVGPTLIDDDNVTVVDDGGDPPPIDDVHIDYAADADMSALPMD